MNTKKKNANVSPAAAELLALTSTDPFTSTDSIVSDLEIADPVIRNSVRNKSTVTLGLDQTFSSVAATAATLVAAIDKAEKAFEQTQIKLREYGKAKRDLYNKTYKSNVVTVNIPYCPTGETELKYAQVICSSKYSVSKDAVLAIKDKLGDSFSKLFNQSDDKVLKPDAIVLFEKILKDVGIPDEKIQQSMSVLFDISTTVSTKDSYESEHEKLPDNLRAILDQIVTRHKPGLKFPK